MLNHLVFLVSLTFVSCQYLNLYEGSECSWRGIKGSCVKAHRCLSAVKDIESKVFPPVCSFDGNTPTICCTDCELVPDTRLLLFNPQLGILTKSGTSKAKDKCLEFIHQLDYPCKTFRQTKKYTKNLDPVKGCTNFVEVKPRFPSGGGASGGVDAKRGQYPHMALLGYGDSSQTAVWVCGGTVISERFILTAGHCLYSSRLLLLFNPQLGILTKSGTSKAKDKCLEFIHQLDYPCKTFRQTKEYTKNLDPVKGCTNFEEVKQRGVPSAGGGVDAKRGQYPHMALLGYGDSFQTAVWVCGGTVISERFILTAGHCLYSSRLGPVKYIGLGILKRSDPEEFWQRYNVQTIFRHPEYKPPSKYHDIALLETDRTILFNSYVRPACLHVDDKPDSYAFATGWGALGHKQGLADILQSVMLSRFDEEECSTHYPPHRLLVNGFDNFTQMCYGDRMDKPIPTDTCEGDSGGPLQSLQHEDCVFTILGVTSYGRQCGLSGGTGMYTRVRSYVSWIEDIVWP